MKYYKQCRVCSSIAIDNSCPKCNHGLTLIYKRINNELKNNIIQT